MMQREGNSAWTHRRDKPQHPDLYPPEPPLEMNPINMYCGTCLDKVNAASKGATVYLCMNCGNNEQWAGIGRGLR